jgi:DNA-binding PucR family transcriptional regulator
MSERVRQTSLEQARSELIDRLRTRREELEAAIFAGVREAVADPAVDSDPDHLAGLREAVRASVDASLENIEQGESWSGPLPRAALSQARRAARNGLSLKTVMRRYAVGSSLLWDFVLEEAARGDLDSAQRTTLLRQAQMVQSSVLDTLMDAIADEYARELQDEPSTNAQRRTDLVKRLLSGQTVDERELRYRVGAVHLGVIATGDNAQEVLRVHSAQIDRELLSVGGEEGTIWAWLGGSKPPLTETLRDFLAAVTDSGVSLALGEPADGLAGFGLTHRQALGAFELARRQSAPITRYADVSLVALALRDELVARSLIDIYLSPLDRDRDGSTLRETLRAYFASAQNAAAAASVLGVHRQTVGHRLRIAEECLGESLANRHAELEIALRLEALLITQT